MSPFAGDGFEFSSGVSRPQFRWILMTVKNAPLPAEPPCSFPSIDDIIMIPPPQPVPSPEPRSSYKGGGGGSSSAPRGVGGARPSRSAVPRTETAPPSIVGPSGPTLGVATLFLALFSLALYSWGAGDAPSRTKVAELSGLLRAEKQRSETLDSEVMRLSASLTEVKAQAERAAAAALAAAQERDFIADMQPSALSTFIVVAVALASVLFLRDKVCLFPCIGVV